MPHLSAVRLMSFGLTAVVLLCLLVDWGGGPPPSLPKGPVPGLGNFRETFGRLPSANDGRLRFAVLGDPEEGLDVFRRLMRQARALGAAFVLITGDIADSATEASFASFLEAYRSLGPEALPTFAAVGNHDIEPTGLFEHYLGPREFSFVHDGCLFIFADNNEPASRPGCARYIRGEIACHRGQAQHVFIVVHKPITDFKKEGRAVRQVREKSTYLYEILDEEHIDAVLAGHYHGYSREMYGETLLLVTGGAGGRLHSSGARHHMVLVDVGPGGVTDRVIEEGGGPAAYADPPSINPPAR